MKRYVLLLGLIGLLAAIVIYFLRDIVIFILYGSTPAHGLIAYFLGAFLVVLPLQMMIGYFAISFYSAKDTKSVFYSHLWSTLIAVTVCYATQSLGNISLVYGIITLAVSNFAIISTLYVGKKL